MRINVQIEIQILNFYKFDSIENLSASFGSLLWDFLWFSLWLLLFSDGHSICMISQLLEVDFNG